ncbi:MAG: AMP-binding protein [Acidimicrobiales bacterium]
MTDPRPDLPPPATFAFADVIESVVDRVPERIALVVDDARLSYAEVDERANRFAHHLASLGVGRDDMVAMYLDNHPDHAIGLLAAFKLAAVPLNVNFRYGARELAALLADAEPVAIVFDPASADVVDEAVAALGPLDRPIARNPVGPELDAALAAASSERPQVERSGEDLYVIYTGGTTGHPKGVVWRQDDAFFACLGGCDMTRLEGMVESPDQAPARIMDWELALFPVAPLMHAAAQWNVLSCWTVGAKAVLHHGALDPDAIWRLVDRENVTSLVIVGDAIGVPLMEQWEASGGGYDVSGLISLSSGGAPISPALRQRIAAAFPDKLIINGYGSSEAGTQALSRQAGSDAKGSDSPGLMVVGTDVKVIDDEGHELAPGSGEIGRLVAGGRLPLRYHKDPAKTAATFVELDGRRYLITGDHASVEADGTIRLHGRGSACINTGGEKVFVEEVEGALLSHPAVRDAVVVGVPDERWGSAVTAVVTLDEPLDLDAAREHCRTTLAGYKLPKHLVVVDAVRRSPAGKADYVWAREVAADAVAGGS